MDVLPDEFSRAYIERIEGVFGVDSSRRLSLPYEYGKTREYHETFGRGEARPGRRRTSPRRHRTVAVRVPLTREDHPEFRPYVYRGDLLGEATSPEALPADWWRDRRERRREYPRTVEPKHSVLAGPSIVAHVTARSWFNPEYVREWYEVRPSVRTGRWYRVETDARYGKVSFATCSCLGSPPSGIHLCEHTKEVLRRIRDGAGFTEIGVKR